MTREQALGRLLDPNPLGYEELDEIFGAFGFLSHSPDFETEVYYHPKYRCGAFTARDDGVHVLSALQREFVRNMIGCVTFMERGT